MITTRAAFGLAVLDNKLYAAGGHKSPDRLDSVEVFSPTTNKWTECKPMMKIRNYVVLVAFERHLYAFGGSNGHLSSPVLIHDDFERYDPSSDTWTLISGLPSPRMCIGATAINDEIILIGGYDGKIVMDDVDHYDPKTNTWRKGTASNTTRRQNGRILAVTNHNLMQ
ncbi:kelch-like protein 25 isoform X2 [Arctopsyche grandis]|uniref:kelch-like protein 25 isoform X2 n=1 Tax=Arctopsyche grandis TaxID=121162 RepID=UPI00406D7B0B